VGIKKDRLLRLRNKLLPKKVKQLLIKHDVVNGVENVRKLVWDDFDVIEFWITEFNNDGLEKAFKHIMAVYDLHLKNDPNWHFIYEGEYTLIRCSYKYAADLEKYFSKYNILHKPIVNWQEGTHVTTIYQPIFKEIFHWTSVLAIQMAKNEEKDFYIGQSADRVVHVFLLQAIYLAEINGDLERLKRMGYDIQYWEAEHMANLSTFRTYHIGTIAGHNMLRDHWDKIRKEQEDCSN